MEKLSWGWRGESTKEQPDIAGLCYSEQQAAPLKCQDAPDIIFNEVFNILIFKLHF